MLWGEVDIGLTSTAVRRREIEGREEKSLALSEGRYDNGKLFICKALTKAHSLPRVRTKVEPGGK